jgi:hypothetical protein
MYRLCLALSLLALPAFCQSMGTAGTVRGKVTDPARPSPAPQWGCPTT